MEATADQEILRRCRLIINLARAIRRPGYFSRLMFWGWGPFALGGWSLSLRRYPRPPSWRVWEVRGRRTLELFAGWFHVVVTLGRRP